VYLDKKGAGSVQPLDVGQLDRRHGDRIELQFIDVLAVTLNAANSRLTAMKPSIALLQRPRLAL